MRKKIIVTGGCGYIGSHTVIELIGNGYDVLVFDNLSNSTEISLDRIEQITGTRPAFVQLDLSDAKETNILFKLHQDVHAVIHFAAHKAVGESVLDPLATENQINNQTLLVIRFHVGVEMYGLHTQFQSPLNICF